MELLWMSMLLRFVLLVGGFHSGNSLQQNGSPTRSSRSPSHPELPVELQKYAEIHFSHLSPKDLRQLDESNGNDEVEHRLKDLELQNWRKNKTSILETIFMKAKVALLRKQANSLSETNGLSASQPRNQPGKNSCIINGQAHDNGSQIIGDHPCNICHCYEGSLLCFVRECQGSPRPDCTPLFFPGTCCPTYSCTLRMQSLEGA